MDTIGDCPEDDIFWDPLEVEALTEEGGDHNRHAESCALARNLQLEEEEARRKDLIARHEAQAMQNDEDTDHMAADWVSFFRPRPTTRSRTSVKKPTSTIGGHPEVARPAGKATSRRNATAEQAVSAEEGTSCVPGTLIDLHTRRVG